jgi:hypothetical protein
MSKPIITRLFIGGLVAFVAGLVVTIFAGLAAFAGTDVTMNGTEVTRVRIDTATWWSIGVATIGVLAMAGGAIAGLVAWIGALINTAQLPDKLWFILLLVLGLFSFGLIAMIAYVLAGPDSTVVPESRATQAAT